MSQVDSPSLCPKNINFPQLWSELKPDVLKVISLEPISHKHWQYMFSDVYSICIAIPESLSDPLYRAVRACIDEHVQRLYKVISNVPRENLLKEYYNMWNTFYAGSLYLNDLFRYLNKQHVSNKLNVDAENLHQYSMFLPANDVKEIGCLALEIWKERLVTPILNSLVELLLKIIYDDRLGNPPECKNVISGVIHSFVQIERNDFSAQDGKREQTRMVRENSMEFYQKEFETMFLSATETFYAALAQKLLSEMTCSEYMEQVLHLLEQEEYRSQCYVHGTTVKKVAELCQKVMVDAHKDKLHAVCHDLITNEDKKDLHNMYRLLKPLPSGLSVMVKEFEEYVKKRGHEAIACLQYDNIPQQFVDNILTVYEKFNEMKTVVFLDDGEFVSGLDKALQTVVNARDPSGGVPKASERLSRYTDFLLRRTGKGLTDPELEKRLSNAIIIFKYIEDKDMFQKYYSKMLANRLIGGLSISMDYEESMINKLKQACGYEFTSKLSRMYTDVGLSQELSESFAKHLTEEKIAIPVQMTPMILQAGSWPLSPVSGSRASSTGGSFVAFNLPRVLQPCIQEFEKFYVQKHTGRKLTWLYNMSHGDVRLNYLDKSYTITMSIHQMAILFCFEDKDTVMMNEIAEAVGLTGELLVKTMKTITEYQVPLLISEGDINAANCPVSLNLSMTNKRLKFRLPGPQMSKATEKETEAVANTVAQDRKYYMECAIVRIMKTRKVMKHNALVTEVMEQTKSRFLPDVQFIKKNIEDLIEKLYIQRTDQNDEYQYLA